jgi:hypothetical protein
VLTLTVGGVISGNWATGRPIRERQPARVMTIEITKANFGREMKNLDKLMRGSSRMPRPGP